MFGLNISLDDEPVNSPYFPILISCLSYDADISPNAGTTALVVLISYAVPRVVISCGIITGATSLIFFAAHFSYKFIIVGTPIYRVNRWNISFSNIFT